MATVADLLGVALPLDASVDSVSILPALLGSKRVGPLRDGTVHHSGTGRFSIRRGDWVLILARRGDDNGRRGEPGWFREVRGYAPHTSAGELYNLSRDPGQRVNPYVAEPEKVRELAALMERYVGDGRSTPGTKQKNDVELVWDKRAN